MACKCITPRVYEVRISRPWWARLIPFTRMYYCQHCEQKTLYFSVFGGRSDHAYKARAEGRTRERSARHSR